MRKKLIALLAAGVMLAQAIPVFADYNGGFDNYTGSLNGYNGWSASNEFTVVADTNYLGSGNVATATKGTRDASVAFNKVTPYEGEDTVDASFGFMLTGQASGDHAGKATGVKFTLKDGDKEIITVISQAINSGGNYKDGTKAADWSAPCLTVATTPNINIQSQLSPSNLYKLAEWVWVTDNGKQPSSGGTPASVWYYTRMLLDFTNKTADVYISKNAPVTDDMIANNTGLYAKGTYPFIDDTATGVTSFVLRQESQGTNVDIGIADLNVLGVSAPDPVGLEAYDVSAVHNNTEGTIRFASTVTGGNADSAGACVVPTRLFHDDFEAANVARVSVSSAVAKGETFGADITGIPASEFDTQLIAKPFIVVDGNVTWADYTQTTSVNAAIN